LLPDRRPTQSEIRGAGRMTTLEAGLSGLFASPMQPQRSPNVNISGTPVSRGNVTYNVYSSAITPRTFQNSFTTAANRSGAVSTNRSGQVNRSVP